MSIAVAILEFLSALGKYLLSLPEQDAAKVMAQMTEQHLKTQRAVSDADKQTSDDLAAADAQLDKLVEEETKP